MRIKPSYSVFTLSLDFRQSKCPSRHPTTCKKALIHRVSNCLAASSLDFRQSIWTLMATTQPCKALVHRVSTCVAGLTTKTAGNQHESPSKQKPSTHDALQLAGQLNGDAQLPNKLSTILDNRTRERAETNEESTMETR